MIIILVTWWTRMVVRTRLYLELWTYSTNKNHILIYSISFMIQCCNFLAINNWLAIAIMVSLNK